jgi:hypothetical protein
MDPRVASVAEGALRRMGGGAPSRPEGVLDLGDLTLAQLSNLASLRMEDPLVARVVEALRAGNPVSLHRERVEETLGLPSYPPQLCEIFDHWFSRIAALGVSLSDDGRTWGIAPRPATLISASVSEGHPVEARGLPERQIFEAILDTMDPSPRPCLIEPGKPCAGCSGRCRTLGF